MLLLLKSPRLCTDLRAESAGIIAAIAQNNFDVQEEMFKMKTVQMLVGIYAQSLDEPAALRAKIIMATSCVVRTHPASEELFVSQFGEMVFVNTVKTTDAVVLRRAVFLAKALAGSDSTSPERVRLLVKCFLPACLPFIANADDTDLREGTLMLLQTFCRSTEGLDCMQGHKDVVLSALDARAGSTVAADASLAEQEATELALVAAVRASLEP